MNNKKPRTDLAVILAAGSGIRIREHVSVPKAMIELEGERLINRSLRFLFDAGIRQVIIVTGYRAEDFAPLADARVRTVHNDKFAQSGSMYSLYQARPFIDRDFLLLESDLYFERRAITILQTETQNNAILISGRTNSGDEVYIGGRELQMDRGRISGLSKQADQVDRVMGELTGLSLISTSLFDTMCAHAEKRFETTLKIEYESNVLHEIAGVTEIFFTRLSDLVWTEIDNLDQLTRARKLIVPRIQEREKVS